VLAWVVALVALLAVLAAGIALSVRRARRRREPKPLPAQWALSPRPVFNTDERRVYRLLREALPHHVILSKLPLVRFSQPDDPNEVRYWYELLGGVHVAFAICSANGRVLAAIDLDSDRGNSKRAMQIKQAVLAACRVRYLRCPMEHLPTVAELQLLIPQSGATPRSPQAAASPAHMVHEASESLSSTVASRRAERTALWQDSGVFQDSFFSVANRLDGMGGTDFGSLGGPVSVHSRLPVDHPAGRNDDIAGVVIDEVPDPHAR
jgi:hypothetical protein